ncbi:MAG: hypothetical protein J7J57_05895 [Caldisericaceae bacterium]|nr:hypothetical protein [Caldisericaceae bacterium]
MKKKISVAILIVITMVMFGITINFNLNSVLGNNTTNVAYGNSTNELASIDQADNSEEFSTITYKSSGYGSGKGKDLEETREEKRPPYVWSFIFALIGFAVLEILKYKKKLTKLFVMMSIDVFLLITFLVSGVTGVLLVFERTAITTVLHTEFSLLLVAGVLIHLIDHLSFYKILFRKRKVNK